LQLGLLHDARVHAEAARGVLSQLDASASRDQLVARAKALANAGELLARTGNAEEALSAAEAALRTAEGPQGDGDVACLACLAKGRALVELGRTDEARKIVSRALHHAVGHQMYLAVFQGLEITGDGFLKVETKRWGRKCRQHLLIFLFSLIGWPVGESARVFFKDGELG
jgi:tetratricopeptide (TPR) repeat protein